MGIRFTCPNGHKLNVKPFFSGKRAVCPKCGVKMRVPAESQTPPGNSDDPRRFDGLGPQSSAGRHDNANPYNNNGPAHNGPAHNGIPDFGPFGPEAESSLEDDIFLDDDTADGLLFGDADLSADAALNEAAFLEDPLDDPRANAALADAAMVDPALGDPARGHRPQDDSASRRPPPASPTPPPLRPPALRPPVSRPTDARPTDLRPTASNSAAGGAGQRGGKPSSHKPILHTMSGAAVDEVIAAASTAPRPRPEFQENPENDPVVRFRLQLKRRNRIMMLVSAALAAVVVVLLIVLIMVLSGQQAEDSPAPAPTAKDPAIGASLPQRPADPSAV